MCRPFLPFAPVMCCSVSQLPRALPAASALRLFTELGHANKDGTHGLAATLELLQCGAALGHEALGQEAMNAGGGH